MRPRLLLLSIVAIVVAACGGQAPGGGAEPTGAAPTAGTTSTQAPPSAADRTPGTSLTACELVAPADLEAVLELAAGTVSDGAYRAIGTTLDPATNECRYSGDDWGGLVVNVTPSNGVGTYNALIKAFGDTAEVLDIGDGAAWFEANDRGYFLKGSVMVLLQITHLSSAPGSFRDPTIALGEAAIAKI